MPLKRGCSRAIIGSNIEEMSRNHPHNVAVAAALHSADESCPTYARRHHYPSHHSSGHSDPPHHSAPRTLRTGEQPMSSYPRMPVSTQPYSSRRRAPSRGTHPYRRHRTESGMRSYAESKLRRYKTVFGPEESVRPSFGDREIAFQEYCKRVGKNLMRTGHMRARAAEQVLDAEWDKLRAAYVAYDAGEVTYSPHRVAIAILEDNFHGA